MTTMDTDDIRSLLQHIEDHTAFAREALDRGDAHGVRAQVVEIKGWAEAIYEASTAAAQVVP